MPFAHLDDIRELSRRSRRTQRAAVCAIVAALLAVPAALAFGQWAALSGVLLVGALLVAYARAAGQERGAYRALIREMKARRKELAAEPAR